MTASAARSREIGGCYGRKAAGGRSVVHALLHDAPVAGRREEKGVVVELITVLHGGAVYLGGRPARMDKDVRITAQMVAGGSYLERAFSRRRTFPAGGKQAPFGACFSQRFLDRATDRRGDALECQSNPSTQPNA